MAKEQGLDLVMVAPAATPPVARIIDYGRFKYITEKQQRENKRKTQDVKGIKISPRIAEHDLTFLKDRAIEFLKEGHKVKVTCQFRSREVTHPELGRQRLDKMVEMLKDYAVVERTPMMEGRLMIMILNPKPQTGSKKQHAKAENQQNGGEAVQDHRDRKDHPATVAQ